MLPPNELQLPKCVNPLNTERCPCRICKRQRGLVWRIANAERQTAIHMAEQYESLLSDVVKMGAALLAVTLTALGALIWIGL